MRSTNKGFVPILIILTIVLLGIVGYFAYKNYKTNQPTPMLSPTSVPIASPTPIPSPIPTSKKIVKTPTPKPTNTLSTSTPQPTTSSSSSQTNSPTPTADIFFSNKNATVTVTYPNGGETLKAGDVVRIQWTMTGPLTNFIIGYSNGPGNLNWIETPYYGNGYYDWTVNVGSNPATQFKIYVSGANLNGAQTSDYSDNYFTVNH